MCPLRPACLGHWVHRTFSFLNVVLSKHTLQAYTPRQMHLQPARLYRWVCASNLCSSSWHMPILVFINCAESCDWLGGAWEHRHSQAKMKYFAGRISWQVIAHSPLPMTAMNTHFLERQQLPSPLLGWCPIGSREFGFSGLAVWREVRLERPHVALL